MIPLLLTTAYLFVMSIMVATDRLDTHLLYVQRDLYLTACENREKIKKQEAKILYESKSFVSENLSAKETEEKIEEKAPCTKKAPSLGYDHERPPNNSRLNFYELFFSNENRENNYSLYKQTAALLRALYPQILPEGGEYRLIDALILKKDETEKFSFPDELSTLSFEDESIQKQLHQLLKGTNESPSLLFFITFDSDTTRFSKKINFLFSRREILLAFFPDSVVDALIEKRAELWAAIEKQQNSDLPLSKEELLTRTKISQQAKALFLQEIEKANLDKEVCDFFEFTLGKKGSILLMENPFTHQLERKKILKCVDHR